MRKVLLIAFVLAFLPIMEAYADGGSVFGRKFGVGAMYATPTTFAKPFPIGFSAVAGYAECIVMFGIGQEAHEINTKEVTKTSARKIRGLQPRV